MGGMINGEECCTAKLMSLERGPSSVMGPADVLVFPPLLGSEWDFVHFLAHPPI